MRVGRAFAAGLGLVFLGCSEAIVSRTTYRSHEAFTDASLDRFERRQVDGPVTKADVLASLGPPIHLIAQPDGEIFVYRREALDRWILNLNPSFVPLPVPTPPIPLYFGSFTRGRDDTLMVFFDREGRMQARGSKLTIDPLEAAP